LNPVEYARTVKRIGNETVRIKNSFTNPTDELDSLIFCCLQYNLDDATLMTTRSDHIQIDVSFQQDLTLVDLTDILPAATIMVVSVTGSTTTGIALPDETMNKVNEACDELLSLEEARIRVRKLTNLFYIPANLVFCSFQILQYVESRMQFIAPNLSAMVGSSIAAKLMGVAGGLTALSKLPATTVQVQ